MKRFGRRHHPVYRLVAIDKRAQRDGRAIEELGSYDPCNKDEDKQVNLNGDRCRYWLGVGAQPSETVHSLLVKQGIVDKDTGKATPAPAAEPADAA